MSPSPASAPAVASASASAPVVTARKSRAGARALPVNKNLRTISLSLVAKVRGRAAVTSAEVANELAKEAVAEVAAAGGGAVTDGDLTAVEKNIRRRLYDSLKVLVSVGVIRREGSGGGKVLRWVGVGHLVPEAVRGAGGGGGGERAAVEEARARVGEKRRVLNGLLEQEACLKMLYDRNLRRAGAGGGSEDEGRIQLPFVLVRTPEETEIKLESTDDARRIFFDFSAYFQVVNDSVILTRIFDAAARDAKSEAKARKKGGRGKGKATKQPPSVAAPRETKRRKLNPRLAPLAPPGRPALVSARTALGKYAEASQTLARASAKAQRPPLSIAAGTPAEDAAAACPCLHDLAKSPAAAASPEASAPLRRRTLLGAARATSFPVARTLFPLAAASDCSLPSVESVRCAERPPKAPSMVSVATGKAEAVEAVEAPPPPPPAEAQFDGDGLFALASPGRGSGVGPVGNAGLGGRRSFAPEPAWPGGESAEESAAAASGKAPAKAEDQLPEVAADDTHLLGRPRELDLTAVEDDTGFDFFVMGNEDPSLLDLDF